MRYIHYNKKITVDLQEQDGIKWVKLAKVNKL